MITPARILLLIAVILFVLAAVGFKVSSIQIGWLGLAFFAAAGIV